MESLMITCCFRIKQGTLDGKVWDPNSQGIADYDEKDFIEVFGEVISYNNNRQLNIKQIRKAAEGEYDPADYMPTSDKSVDGMLRSCVPTYARYPTITCVRQWSITLWRMKNS